MTLPLGLEELPISNFTILDRRIRIRQVRYVVTAWLTSAKNGKVVLQHFEGRAKISDGEGAVTGIGIIPKL